MNKFLIFTAPSGGGKTTILKKIMSSYPQLNFSISATSRPPRNGEINGKDYYFLSAKEFKAKIKNDEFLEWEEVYQDQFYGTLKSEIKRINDNNQIPVFDLDVIGAHNLQEKYREYSKSIFIKPPSIEVLKERLINRKTEDEESLNKRLFRAKMEIEKAPCFDHVIVNDKLEVALQSVDKIVENYLSTSVL